MVVIDAVHHSRRLALPCTKRISSKKQREEGKLEEATASESLQPKGKRRKAYVKPYSG
jgi:hypothetical protein